MKALRVLRAMLVHVLKLTAVAAVFVGFLRLAFFDSWGVSAWLVCLVIVLTALVHSINGIETEVD